MRRALGNFNFNFIQFRIVATPKGTQAAAGRLTRGVQLTLGRQNTLSQLGKCLEFPVF